MNILVRKYEDKDLESVNKILNSAFEEQKSEFNDNNITEIVAEVDNIVVGYLILTKVLNPIKGKYYYLIDYVCVDENYRGKGIGKKLLDYSEEYARNNNAIYLQLTCSTFRTSAHRLYKKCGYKKRDSYLYRKGLE